jgi:hypothetical protein
MQQPHLVLTGFKKQGWWQGYRRCLQACQTVSRATARAIFLSKFFFGDPTVRRSASLRCLIAIMSSALSHVSKMLLRRRRAVTSMLNICAFAVWYFQTFNRSNFEMLLNCSMMPCFFYCAFCSWCTLGHPLSLSGSTKFRERHAPLLFPF